MPVLTFGLAVSTSCAVFANMVLLMRFLERHVRVMTLVTMFFLIIHGKSALTWNPLFNSCSVPRYYKYSGGINIWVLWETRRRLHFCTSLLVHRGEHCHQHHYEHHAGY